MASNIYRTPTPPTTFTRGTPLSATKPVRETGVILPPSPSRWKWGTALALTTLASVVAAVAVVAAAAFLMIQAHFSLGVVLGCLFFACPIALVTFVPICLVKDAWDRAIAKYHEQKVNIHLDYFAKHLFSEGYNPIEHFEEASKLNHTEALERLRECSSKHSVLLETYKERFPDQYTLLRGRTS